MNSGGGRAIGDEPGSIRAELDAFVEEKPFGWRRAELERQAAAEISTPLDPAFVTAFRKEMRAEVWSMKKEAELDAEADRQRERMEREMAELEREIDAASEGTLGEPFARFVQELQSEDGTARALLDGMTPEEKAEARRVYLEEKSKIVNVPADVLDAVFTLEASIRGLSKELRRRALSHALWRALAGMNESERLWIESITLRDGGRKVSFELLALWSREGQ